MGQKEETKKQKTKQRKRYALAYTLFCALIISNLTGYIGLFWTTASGNELRQIINYIVGPLILFFLSNSLFEKMEDHQIRIKSTIINNIIIFIIISLATISCVLDMKYEAEKSDCIESNIDKANILRCFSEAEKNLLVLSKIF